MSILHYEVDRRPMILGKEFYIRAPLLLCYSCVVTIYPHHHFKYKLEMFCLSDDMHSWKTHQTSHANDQRYSTE